MTIIYAATEDQHLVATILPKLAQNNVNTVRLSVDFDASWDTYTARSAVFTTSKSARPYSVPMSASGDCLIPPEVLAEECKLYIVVEGVNSSTGTKKSSTRLTVKVLGGHPAVIISDPSPSVYQQLLTENAVLRSRMSGLEAAGTVDGSEVIGIRTGADGTVYDTAGDAVRAQFVSVNNKIDNIVRLVPEWTDGVYISKGGNVVEYDGYSASQQIPIRSEVVDSVTVMTCASVDSTAYCFFDLYGKKIEGANIGYNATDLRTYELTVPEGAAFLRYSCKTNRTEGSYIEFNLSPANLSEHLNDSKIADEEILYADVITDALVGTYATVGSGQIATTSNEAVQCAEVSVNAGETYEIKGYSVSEAALYALYDEDGNCLTTYPAETDGAYTYHEVEVTIPDDCVKLVVGHYVNKAMTTVKLTNLVECVLSRVDESRRNINDIKRQVDADRLYRYAIDNILCIGDSLTSGAYYANGWTGGNIKQGFPYYLARMCGCSVTNAGRSGWSASDWVKGMLRAYDFANYDAVFIWLGTNYGCQTMPTDAEIEAFTPATDPTASEANQALYLAYIVRMIQESNPDCLIFLGTVYASKSGVSKNNAVVYQIAEKYDLQVIDLSDLSYSKHPELHAGVNNPHLGKAGNIYVANRLTSALHSYIAEDPTRAEFGILSK